MSAEGLSLRGWAPERLPVPGPAMTPDVVLGAAAERARRALVGFAPAHLLSDVSVARAVGMVADDVRQPGAWLRVMLSGLEEFRLAQPSRRLAPALGAAWSVPGRADQALADFAAHLGDVPPAELARLGLGPKLWYTVNGVPVAWRPLPGGGSVRPTPTMLHLDDSQRLHTAARVLRRAGLASPELMRLRIGDLGRLAPGGVFVPELLAEPLIVRVRPGRNAGSRPGDDPWLVLLGNETRVAVVAAVLSRYGMDAACRHGRDRIFPGVEPGGVD